MTALKSTNEVLGEKKAAHLLRRSTFGPTITEIKYFAGLTPQQAVDLLLQDDQALPAPPVDPKTGTSWVNPPTQNAAGENNSEQNALFGYYKSWHMDVMLKSPNRLKERVTWFYHTHLPARWTEIRSSEAIYYQNCLYRHYALGSFRELFKKICTDNAMLVYLDGYTNHKDNPNENFAREMFELYSIGKGPQLAEGNYTYFTEQDVKAATRVLTGWVFDKTFSYSDPDHQLPAGKMITASFGNPPQVLATGHDSGEKVFSAFYDNQIIKPSETINNLTTPETAYNELYVMIDMIFDKVDTARFITRKLYRFFVYHFISEETESTIIRPLADVLYNNDYNIGICLKTLLSSQHFYDTNNVMTSDDIRGSLIKSPVDLLAGLLRFFEVSLPDRNSDSLAFYNDMDNTISMFEDQGLNFYEPFEVAGYPAYHQVPGFNRNWITTYALANRYRIADILMKRADNEEHFSYKLDILDWVENSGYITDPGDSAEIVNTLIGYLIPIDLNEERINYFLKTVFLDTLPAPTWTYEWNAYKNTSDDSVVRERLEIFLSSLIQTPEFQIY